MTARIAWFAVWASVTAALLTTLWFVAVTLGVRVPYWGEAEVLFEASRLRDHLPLYVDPLVGATEYGAPPSRYYVTYPPLWTWVVSLAPAGSAVVVARLACAVAWFGSLGALAWTAPRASRRQAALAAAFVAGVWVLANFATVGRPDAIACAVAAFALARAMRRGRVDGASIALLVLVPWVKPTILGLPAGALAGACAADRARAPRTAAVALVLVVASAAAAHVASGGALFAHVVRSNAQPFTLDAWLAQVPSRLPFFAPLFGWAALAALRDRHSPGARIGLGALAGSVLWTLVALAKTGSSSNYWMAPALVAVVVIARSAPLRLGDGRLEPAAALACVLWTDIASVRGAVEHARTFRSDAAVVAGIRARAGLADDGVIAADEAGIELVTNGRILTPTYQMAHLVRAGAYPAAPWIADLTAAPTRLFVEHTGQLRLAPELERALEAHYRLSFERAGFRVWTRR